jgi:hypothetical protein
VKPLPDSDDRFVIRTDFSSEQAWQAVRAGIAAPVGEFVACVRYIDDRAYDGASKDEVTALFSPSAADHPFVMLADATTMSHPEHPLLVIDLFDEAFPEFRAVAAAVQSIENNLSIANMDFEEFADAVDTDGIYRGFRHY